MTPTADRRFRKRPEERPEELLTAALEIFAERGFRATRLEDVAARAGVSKGTVYLYFRNKEDLLVQALSRYLDAGMDLARERIEEAGGSAAQRLEAVLRKLWIAAQEPTFARVYRLVVGEVAARHPAVFQTWAEKGPIPVWELLARIVEEGQASGEFRRDVGAGELVRVLATGLIQQAYFEAHTLLGRRAPADRQRIADSAIRVFLRGLEPG
jgi:AcrR family transcriptional regulator